LLLRSGILSNAWNTLSGGERQRAAIACALILACAVETTTTNNTNDNNSETKEDNSPLDRIATALENNTTNGKGDDGIYISPNDTVLDPVLNSLSWTTGGETISNIANFPDTILLLDEPTAACDPQTCLAVERALI